MGRCDAAFIAQREHLLWLYALPYDATEPVVCFDERPCFLIGDRVEPLALQSGQVRKEHYAYEKHGSCALLAAIEPLTGQRVGHVYPQRTKREYTLFCKALAVRYPQARTVHLVQDHLNTHHISAFYQYLPADEAFALAQRFTFHYTPKSASWLNRIEIEFSALARGCLQRRILTQEQLAHEVLSLLQERQHQNIKIHWQFSIEKARSKLNRHYQSVHPDNQKFEGKKT